MKKIIKRFLIKILFSKKQREVIQQAVIFSEYNYRKKGEVDMAARVQCVLDEITPVLGIIKQNFTKDEVDTIVSNFSKEQNEIFKMKLKEAFEEGVNSFLKNLKPVGCICFKSDDAKEEGEVENTESEKIEEQDVEEVENEKEEK